MPTQVLWLLYTHNFISVSVPRNLTDDYQIPEATWTMGGHSWGEWNGFMVLSPSLSLHDKDLPGSKQAEDTRCVNTMNTTTTSTLWTIMFLQEAFSKVRWWLVQATSPMLSINQKSLAWCKWWGAANVIRASLLFRSMIAYRFDWLGQRSEARNDVRS
jgi:hypothetical protein